MDASASSLFGTVNRQKRDLAAEIGAVLAYAAITNNDKVGLLVFSDQVELLIPPRKGRTHVLRLIRDLLAVEPAHTGTDISLALQMVNQSLRRRSIVFLISDFLVDNKAYERDLMVTSFRHDVVALVLSDPLEQEWPEVGMVQLRDAETGQTEWVDTAAAGWQKRFREQTSLFRQMRELALTRAQVDRIDMPVNGDYVRALTSFFQRRQQRLRR